MAVTFKSKEEIVAGDSGSDCTGKPEICKDSHCCGKGIPLKATFNKVEVTVCQHKDATQFWHETENKTLLKMSFSCASGAMSFRMASVMAGLASLFFVLME